MEGSPLHLPRRHDLSGGGVLRILELDAHGGKLVADAIGFFEVLRLAGGVAGIDELVNQILIKTFAVHTLRRLAIDIEMFNSFETKQSD